jgi:uncharacterized protein (TIGR00369 family)
MEVVDDKYCFICGSCNPDGLQLNFQVENNKSFCKLQIAEKFQGWQNIVHGGILASLLDEAAIYACREISMNLVTAEITVKYHKPVPTGKELEVIGEVTEQRSKLLIASSKIVLDGQIMASAVAKIFVINK